MTFWEEQNFPHIRQGERVLVSAHRNMLRALVTDLASMGIGDVEGFQIPTATPVVYRFDRKEQPIDWHCLNGNVEIAKSA